MVMELLSRRHAPLIRLGSARTNFSAASPSASPKHFQLGGHDLGDGVDHACLEIEEPQAFPRRRETHLQLREIALAELCVDVDLADTGAIARRTSSSGSPDAPWSESGTSTLPADRVEPLPVEPGGAAYLPWTFPMETARQSHPVAATNRPPSSGR